jgi:hypothetical protein
MAPKKSSSKTPATVVGLRASAIAAGAVRTKTRRAYVAAHFSSEAAAQKWAARIPGAALVKPCIVLARMV